MTAEQVLKAAPAQPFTATEKNYCFSICTLAVTGNCQWVRSSGEVATLYDVQHLLGHQSPQTSTRYAHLASSRLREVSANVAELVGDVH